MAVSPAPTVSKTSSTWAAEDALGAIRGIGDGGAFRPTGDDHRVRKAEGAAKLHGGGGKVRVGGQGAAEEGRGFVGVTFDQAEVRVFEEVALGVGGEQEAGGGGTRPDGVNQRRGQHAVVIIREQHGRRASSPGGGGIDQRGGHGCGDRLTGEAVDAGKLLRETQPHLGHNALLDGGRAGGIGEQAGHVNAEGLEGGAQLVTRGIGADDADLRGMGAQRAQRSPRDWPRRRG